MCLSTRDSAGLVWSGAGDAATMKGGGGGAGAGAPGGAVTSACSRALDLFQACFAVCDQCETLGGAFTTAQMMNPFLAGGKGGVAGPNLL